MSASEAFLALNARKGKRFGAYPDVEISSQHAATLEEVSELMTTVREEIYKRGLKSSNKYTPGKPGDLERNTDADRELARLYQLPPGDGVERAFSASAHNCQELVNISAELLRAMGFYVHEHAFPGDHVVVVCSRTRLPELPEDWKDWKADDIFVCDAWSNTACAAADYRERFLGKMAKWSGRGKRVWELREDDKDPESPDHWIDPLTPRWLESLFKPRQEPDEADSQPADT